MTHLCPACQQQVRQGQPQVRVYNQRWHRDCWPGSVERAVGRPRRSDGVATKRLVARVTPGEYAQVSLDAHDAGLDLSAYVRRALGL